MVANTSGLMDADVDGTLMLAKDAIGTRLMIAEANGAGPRAADATTIRLVLTNQQPRTRDS